MINISHILKRAWHTLWNYRVLWIFGFLLALTSGNGGSNGGGGSHGNGGPSQDSPRDLHPIVPDDAPGWVHELNDWANQTVVPMFTHPEQYISTFVTIGVILLVVILIIALLTALVRYPAETAVIRMVDEYETSGNKVGFRQGWKLGWNRTAFRLWLIDFVLSLPIIALLLIMLGAGVLVYFSISSTFQVTNTAGIVTAIGLGFLSLFLIIVFGLLIGVVRNFFKRVAALENTGVKETLRNGWGMFKRNWKSVGLVWIVMIGIGIGFGIAAIIAFVLLVPAYLLLILPAGLVAAIPALIAYAITSIFAAGPLAWIIAALAAIPFFFAIVFAPLQIVNGWYLIYESNVWTLAYREIKVLETRPSSPELDPVPALSEQ